MPVRGRNLVLSWRSACEGGISRDNRNEQNRRTVVIALWNALCHDEGYDLRGGFREMMLHDLLLSMIV